MPPKSEQSHRQLLVMSKVIWLHGNILRRCRGRTVKLRIRPDDVVTGHLPALVTYGNNCAATVCTAAFMSYRPRRRRTPP